MQKVIFCVLILSTLSCHGCIPVPINTSKVIINSIDPSFIKVGVTTMEDVVLRCGNPSGTVSNDERVLTYSWDTLTGYTKYLRIYFDENDIVKNYTIDEKKKD